ncbi:hypothetical protein DBP19_36440 [Streptomyces sp. CS090A]|uniref:hypothetical protein n=1 Tax=Streptomyces sp. CS090A TaxID=2162710 RepID=UPI000D524305|nr:hypothetical protein [Streptomyces sp. CS090A]PVC80630.1 hypothetical protein DBP19_36440 [Streptomyces sp. CS090A]
MSANTVPAAVPGPNGPTPPVPAHAPTTAPTTTPAPAAAGSGTGLLASLMTPVQPARTAFNLGPANTPQGASQGAAQTTAQATPGGTAVPAGGVSSAAFHDDTTTPNGKTANASENTSGKTKQGMIRALVLAAAARWAKGGGTANKRLDTQKAAAQAQQVKETRQVTVNRSPSTGFSGGGRSNSGSPGGGPAAGGGGKSLTRKSSGGGAKNSGSTGPKNSTGPAKTPNNPGPNGGGSNRGPSGSGSPGRGNTGGPGGSGGGNNTGTAAGPKPVKAKDAPAPAKNTPPAPKDNKTSGGGGAPQGGQKGTPGAAGKPGRDGKAPAGAPGATKAQPQGRETGDGGKGGKADPRIPKQTTSSDKNPGGASGKGSTDTAKGGKAKHSLIKDRRNKDAANRDAPTSKTAAGKTTAPATQGTPDGKPLATQPSRETGYRDGARAGKAAAHAKAYRDGVKDGWADALQAGNHEKGQLDEAHAARKQHRDLPVPNTDPVPTEESEQPVTTTTTSSAERPTTPASPEPIQVTSIDATTLHLGDNATRPTISRGEVRSLKQYERLLTVRLTSLQAAAESTKKLEAHAQAQAQSAQNLSEDAKSVKGGEKLAATLARLYDNAKQQAAEAAELHKRTVRAADHCQATLANVAARYSGLYQAVVDSPETVPAELSYYKGA